MVPRSLARFSSTVAHRTIALPSPTGSRWDLLQVSSRCPRACLSSSSSGAGEGPPPSDYEGYWHPVTPPVPTWREKDPPTALQWLRKYLPRRPGVADELDEHTLGGIGAVRLYMARDTRPRTNVFPVSPITLSHSFCRESPVLASRGSCIAYSASGKCAWARVSGR